LFLKIAGIPGILRELLLKKKRRVKMRSRIYKTLSVLFATFFLITALNISLPQRGEAAAGMLPELPDIQAKAAILMDEGSGRILYAKNAHLQLPPASLTKIMTAILVIENGDLDQKVSVSRYAAETGESSIWLEEGEVLTRRELLYALMLVSANDAAVALAESVAGSEGAFVEKMNSRAGELQLSNTHFVNPHGLQDQEHYSSAYDLAVITREGMRYHLFREVVATREKYLPWPGHPWQRALINKNRLLSRYQGATGVKTGYTRQAGNCLVGAAQRGNLRLIAVVLNSPQVYEDTEKLLDYGFQNYQAVILQKREQAGSRLPVRKGERRFVKVAPQQDVIVAVNPEEKKHLSYRIELVRNVEAPVKKGEVLGTGRILLRGKEIGSVELLAEESVSLKPPLWQVICSWLWSLFLKIIG
jgi:D-alanyl-D-alanine carboxypeptidase (penicillin-binding protein 5/6)